MATEHFARVCQQAPASDVCKALGNFDGTDFAVRGGFAAGIMCEKADRCGYGRTARIACAALLHFGTARTAAHTADRMLISGDG